MRKEEAEERERERERERKRQQNIEKSFRRLLVRRDCVD
jgi:hypothetical protein